MSRQSDIIIGNWLKIKMTLGRIFGHLAKETSQIGLNLLCAQIRVKREHESKGLGTSILDIKDWYLLIITFAFEFDRLERRISPI